MTNSFPASVSAKRRKKALTIGTVNSCETSVDRLKCRHGLSDDKVQASIKLLSHYFLKTPHVCLGCATVQFEIIRLAMFEPPLCCSISSVGIQTIDGSVKTVATPRVANFRTNPCDPRRQLNSASSWNRVGDFGLVSRLCLLRSNPSVRSAPSFRPDLHARYADARSGGQGWPAFGPPLQRREASLTAASTTA